MNVPSNMKATRDGEAGFSMLQLIVAVAIIAIVSSFGFMQIRNSQRDLTLSGEMRKFSAYLEKGRIEAVRRHTSVTVITINDSSSYTATLDSNFDGSISASETTTVTLPTGVTFSTGNITFPATVTYDLKGRSTLSNVTGSTLSMTNANGSSTSVTMTGGGDVTLDSTVTGPAANTNLAPVTTVTTTANIKSMN